VVNTNVTSKKKGAAFPRLLGGGDVRKSKAGRCLDKFGKGRRPSRRLGRSGTKNEGYSLSETVIGSKKRRRAVPDEN